MRRMIVAITGASGSIYGVRLLELLRTLPDMELHLVMSKSAARTIAVETDRSIKDIEALAHVVHAAADIGASIASGSFRSHGMIVAPCSIKTMSNIACGNTGDLISRAADVMLKERRRLVLMVRESPLHAGHLDNMSRLSTLGATIFPPVAAFYTKPQSIEQMVDTTLMRVLDQFDIDIATGPRWTGR